MNVSVFFSWVHSMFPLLVWVLVIFNLCGFIFIGWDKYKAIHHQWRIAERSFYFLALLGGVYGIWIGMYCFHHKTKKQRFLLVIYPLLLLHLFLVVLVVSWYFSLQR